MSTPLTVWTGWAEIQNYWNKLYLKWFFTDTGKKIGSFTRRSNVERYTLFNKDKIENRCGKFTYLYFWSITTFPGETIYMGFTQGYICHCITQSWEVNSTHLVDDQTHCSMECRDMTDLNCGGQHAFSVWWIDGMHIAYNRYHFYS